VRMHMYVHACVCVCAHVHEFVRVWGGSIRLPMKLGIHSAPSVVRAWVRVQVQVCSV